jgi:ketosteroid isomerase-like protein
MPAKNVPASASFLRALLSLIACIAIFLSIASPASAQKDKKKKKDAPDTNITNAMTNEQQIDYKISEMLGAWQVGDVDRLHQDYADDAVFVSGVWAPPVFGWSNYVAIFQQQRTRMQQVRMDRYNTFTKVNGTVGWACYQWDFSGTVDGQPMESRGQTTLVFEKRGDRWLIVHNHTSVAQGAPAGTPQLQPNKPPSS